MKDAFLANCDRNLAFANIVQHCARRCSGHGMHGEYVNAFHNAVLQCFCIQKHCRCIVMHYRPKREYGIDHDLLRWICEYIARPSRRTSVQSLFSRCAKFSQCAHNNSHYERMYTIQSIALCYNTRHSLLFKRIATHYACIRCHALESIMENYECIIVCSTMQGNAAK